MRKVVTINSFKSYGDCFGDYCRSLRIEVKHYSLFKKPSTMFLSKRKVILLEIIAFIKLLYHLHLFYSNKIYCTGNQFATMALYRFLRPFIGSKDNSHLYIHNFYLHSLGNNKYVKRIIAWLLNNDRITLICQSPNEICYYKELSNRCKLEFVPYSSDFVPKLENSNVIVKYSDYCFSGGYTNRDYELIGKLARRHQDRLFIIIASSLNTNISNLPLNVKVLKDLKRDLFETYLSHSSCVIVALKEDVGSSGQMLAISAMRNKKPIIYTNVDAVNYYFSESCGYPYDIGDINSLEKAYCAVFSNYDEALTKGKNAYNNSKNFTLDNCNKRIVEIMSKPTKEISYEY